MLLNTSKNKKLKNKKPLRPGFIGFFGQVFQYQPGLAIKPKKT